MAVQEVVTKLCSCDLCKKSVNGEDQLKSLYIPVKFTERTKGNWCEPYYKNEKFDLCKWCLEKVTVVFGEGVKGNSEFWLKKIIRTSNQWYKGRW